MSNKKIQKDLGGDNILRCIKAQHLEETDNIDNKKTNRHSQNGN